MTSSRAVAAHRVRAPSSRGHASHPRTRVDGTHRRPRSTHISHEDTHNVRRSHGAHGVVRVPHGAGRREIHQGDDEQSRARIGARIGDERGTRERERERGDAT